MLPGKWCGHTYRIVRFVGRGANGAVYQALRDRSVVAIKIGDNAAAVALEYGRMRELTTSLGASGIIPELYEQDDVEHGGELYPALVMEFVRGVSPEAFIDLRGRAWIPLCLTKLLRLLEALHAKGYAFCDLKSANLLFDPDTGEPRLIDFGGLTPIGQAVREFTELYDRAWWGRGTRKADCRYDLFACAMLGLQLMAPIDQADMERLRTRRPVERDAFLNRCILSDGSSWRLRAANNREGNATAAIFRDGQRQLQAVLSKALKDQYRDPAEFRMALAVLLVHDREETRGTMKHTGETAKTAVGDGVGLRPRGRRRAWDATDWGLLVAVTIFAATMGALLWLGSL